MKMRSETGLGLPDPRLFDRNSEHRGASVRRAVAIAALLGAPLAGVAGVLVDADRLLAASTEPFVAYAANALLLAVIPLLMLGAFLLDTLEQDYQRHRAARRTGRRSALRLVDPSAE